MPWTAGVDVRPGRRDRPAGSGEQAPGGTYVYGPADRVVTQSGPGGTTTRTYDKSGALAATSGPAGATSYSYDAAARLTKVVRVSGATSTTVDYTYDGDGNRISRTAGGTTTAYVWDPFGAIPLLVLEQVGGVVQRRYFHGDGPVAVQTLDDTLFFHVDPVGSTNQLTVETATSSPPTPTMRSVW